MSDDSDAPREEAGDVISLLMQELMEGIPERAGGGAERQAWNLLHQVRGDLTPEGMDDPRAFVNDLIELSEDFVHQEGDENERHDRLLAVNNIMVNILRPSFGGGDGEDLEMRFEELRDCLFNIERINGRNPSVETRLRAIYDGLIELSQTLGIAPQSSPPE